MVTVGFTIQRIIKFNMTLVKNAYQFNFKIIEFIYKTYIMIFDKYPNILIL